MRGISAAFHEVQFQAEVRRAHPLSLKLTRLGGASMLDGLAHALNSIQPAYQNMKPASFALAAVGALVLSATACEGLKEAMTAHTDTARARARQELSVDTLAKLLASATVPPRKDVAEAIANAWVDYKLLGSGRREG